MSKGSLIWGNLVHLGRNMCSDVPLKSFGKTPQELLSYICVADHLRCDEKVWDDITQRMADAGMNMAVINIGEGIQLESHPELAVKGSWSIEKVREKLQRLRTLGLEPIPKMNFSACHDLWLKDYSRMLSTSTYYKVCADVIREVIDIFDGPRFFHLGYDEETYNHQKNYNFVAIRQHDLWWHDFLWFVKTVEDKGVRPWIWSDYIWSHEEAFLNRMPKSVLQSNWYYGKPFDPELQNTSGLYVRAYLALEKAGFDQIPTGSNWSHDDNFNNTVNFCRKNIAPERLKGFMMAPWKATAEPFRENIEQAIDLAGKVISGDGA